MMKPPRERTAAASVCFCRSNNVTQKMPASGPERKRSRKVTQDDYRWYRRDPTKALAGMRGMTPEQKGVYCVIIELCYEQRGPLADDDKMMARACDCDVRQYRRIKAELLAIGRIVNDPDAGTIYDERAIRELVQAEVYSQTQAERAGKRRGAKVVQLRVVETPKPAPEDDVSEPRSALARPLASPQLGGELGPKLEHFSNEIKGRAPAKRKEKNRYTSTVEPNLVRDGASAPPCRLEGGGAPVAPRPKPHRRRDANGPEPPPITPEQRAEKLAAMRRALLGDEGGE